MKDVIKAFGEGQPTEISVLLYPSLDSEDQYLFVFGAGGRLEEVLRHSPGTEQAPRVWP